MTPYKVQKAHFDVFQGQIWQFFAYTPPFMPAASPNSEMCCHAGPVMAMEC